MDYEFLERFTPRIIHINRRGLKFWNEFQFVMHRDRTALPTLAYVYSGKGSLWLDGIHYPLTEGHVFHYVAGQSMRLESDIEEPLRFYSFQFRFCFVRWKGDEPYFHPVAGALPVPNLFHALDHTLREKFEQAFEWWSQKKPGYTWETRLVFLQIVKQLVEHWMNQSDGGHYVKEHVEKAIAYMNEHYAEPLTRDMMAEHVSLSPAYFSVVFKRVTGEPPIQYLNRIRIDKAKSLLKQTRLTVSQIAQEVGIPDPFYFTRLFTHYVGIPPRDFRNG